MAADSESAVMLGLDFVEALTQRAYEKAFAMTATDLADESGVPINLDTLRENFEVIVPVDWNFVDMEVIDAAATSPEHLRPKYIRGPLAIMDAETDWVEEPDVAFMYVSIASDVEGEGLSIIVTSEGSELKVREITFGRP
jgi:hypothetical protein